jgi:hypothetical protein
VEYLLENLTKIFNKQKLLPPHAPAIGGSKYNLTALKWHVKLFLAKQKELAVPKTNDGLMVFFESNRN